MEELTQDIGWMLEVLLAVGLFALFLYLLLGIRDRYVNRVLDRWILKTSIQRVKLAYYKVIQRIEDIKTRIEKLRLERKISKEQRKELKKNANGNNDKAKRGNTNE